MNYRELFGQYCAAEAGLFPNDDRQNRYESFCLKLAGKKFKTFAALRKKKRDFTDKIFNRYLDFYNKQFEEKKKKIKEIGAKLSSVADETEIVPGGEVRIVKQFSRGTYSCQTQPEFYAKVAAQAYSLQLAAAGIENQVEASEFGFDVLAGLEPWQVDCFSRKTFDFNEWIYYCVGMGANPMVYNPYLNSTEVWQILRERGTFNYNNKYEQFIQKKNAAGLGSTGPQGGEGEP